MTWMSSVDRDLMETIVALLRDRLPRPWRIDLDVWESPDTSLRVRWQLPDYRLTISPPTGRPARVAAVVRQSLTPKAALEAGSAVRLALVPADGTLGLFEDVDGALLVTYFLSERARELLAPTGISYADSTGNIRISLDDPPLFIETSGLNRLPASPRYYTPKALTAEPTRVRQAILFDQTPRLMPPRVLQSFKGPGAALGIRALVDYRPPYGLRELAEQAGVSLGTLSRVLDFAEGEVLIERASRGPITRVDWEGFLRRWAKDYSLFGSNESRLFLEPRGVGAVAERLRSFEGRYAVSGSLAAHTVAPEAPAALAVIYVDSLDVADELRLRPTDTGGNVMLVRPFPSARSSQALAPFLRTRMVDQVVYVALSQAVVDLLTSPGRGPAEAEALLTWMKANEDAWRLA